MPGPAPAALNPSAPGVLAYAWASDVVIVACHVARRRTATDALGAAIADAIADPSLGHLPPPSARAIVVGTQSAAIAETARFAREIDEVGAALVNPALFPLTVMNAASGLAAIQHQCEGPNVTLSNGASSALDALVYAADLVVDARASVVFAGGFETLAGESAGRESALAVIWMLMTAERSLALNAGPCARLVAAASAASAIHDEAIDLSTALVAAAAHAGRHALEPHERQSVIRTVVIGSAVLALEALADAVQAGEGVTALVTGGQGEPVGTALILARARSSGERD
jgi:3-oxoacyl-[acyl-carrier-protein] synthase II